MCGPSPSPPTMLVVQLSSAELNRVLPVNNTGLWALGTPTEASIPAETGVLGTPTGASTQAEAFTRHSNMPCDCFSHFDDLLGTELLSFSNDPTSYKAQPSMPRAKFAISLMSVMICLQFMSTLIPWNSS